MEVCVKWYDCGLALGVLPHTLDAIKVNQRDDCDDCYRETLKEWLKGANPLPTWSALCKALKSPAVRYEALAEKLSKQRNYYRTVL